MFMTQIREMGAPSVRPFAFQTTERSQPCRTESMS